MPFQKEVSCFPSSLFHSSKRLKVSILLNLEKTTKGSLFSLESFLLSFALLCVFFLFLPI